MNPSEVSLKSTWLWLAHPGRGVPNSCIIVAGDLGVSLTQAKMATSWDLLEGTKHQKTTTLSVRPWEYRNIPCKYEVATMLQLTFMGIYPTLKLKTERGPLLVIVGWLNPWLNPPFVVADPVLSLFSMRPDVGSSKVRHALQVFKQKFTYAPCRVSELLRWMSVDWMVQTTHRDCDFGDGLWHWVYHITAKCDGKSWLGFYHLITLTFSCKRSLHPRG